jgi:hypothetical protein
MSRALKIIIVAAIFLIGAYWVDDYLKDKIPSIRSDLNLKENRDLLYKFFKLNDKRAVFCDLRLTPSQSEQFEMDLNSSNRVYVDSLLGKKVVKYIFIISEDGSSDFDYDPKQKELKGIFWVEHIKDTKIEVFKLRSITPKDLKRLNNL